MKKIIPLLFISLSLAACSSSNVTLLENQIHAYSGGQRQDDTVSYFWYTEHNRTPYDASDYVQSEKDGWYQTHYRWDSDTIKIKEVQRTGKTLRHGQLVPFSVHIRYNQQGEAVYQLYSVAGKVFPMEAKQLASYAKHGQEIAQFTKQQDKHGSSLIQGYWNGSRFDSCDGKEYSTVEFAQTLPSFVVHRLSSIDNYLAILGSVHQGKVRVKELLVLANDDHQCIKPPQPLDDE